MAVVTIKVENGNEYILSPEQEQDIINARNLVPVYDEDSPETTPERAAKLCFHKVGETKLQTA